MLVFICALRFLFPLFLRASGDYGSSWFLLASSLLRSNCCQSGVDMAYFLRNASDVISDRFLTTLLVAPNYHKIEDACQVACDAQSLCA